MRSGTFGGIIAWCRWLWPSFSPLSWTTATLSSYTGVAKVSKFSKISQLQSVTAVSWSWSTGQNSRMFSTVYMREILRWYPVVEKFHSRSTYSADHRWLLRLRIAPENSVYPYRVSLFDEHCARQHVGICWFRAPKCNDSDTSLSLLHWTSRKYQSSTKNYKYTTTKGSKDYQLVLYIRLTAIGKMV